MSKHADILPGEHIFLLINSSHGDGVDPTDCLIGSPERKICLVLRLTYLR